MPTFTYQAKRGPSDVVEGKVQAANREEVVSRLLQDGLVPVTILDLTEEVSQVTGRAPRIRINPKERRLFTRQLTSLLRAKVELVPAVTILKEQSGSRTLRQLLDSLERDLRDGNAFSDAVARHPQAFPSLFLSAIRAGEAAGKLDDILLKLVEFDDQQEQLESRLRGALAYPVLLLIVGIGCLAFFLWAVVPRMAGLFTQLGGALPWPTRMLLGVSDSLTHQGGWIVAASGLVIAALARLRRLPVVVLLIERVMMRTPFAREILEARQVGRFTRTLQLLLHSGLPVFQAMDVARPTLGSAIMEARLREAQEHVKRGESIASSLRAARCFPVLVTQMIAVGESAGTLVDVLDEMATYYERFLDEALRVMTSLLEPGMIVVMGLLIGFCVLAMVLPVFQMTQLVR